MKKILIIALGILVCGCGCSSGPKWNPYDLPDYDEIDINVGNVEYNGRAVAPMCWSVYEYCYEREQAGQGIDMNEAEWQKNIDWVAENLLPYGYDMIITDGFMAMWNHPEVCPDGYMTHYGGMSLKELVRMCKEKGLKFGVYDNPLWKHCSDETLVPETNVTWGSLMYKDDLDRNVVKYPDAGEVFSWIVPSHDGAEECIEGFFKWYSSIGINYIRMDFLCLFESASGAGGMPCKGYGRDNYELALQYISKYAKKYGVFTSLVMPNLYDDAELEAEYGDMIRIVADTFHGGWDHVSDRWRGGVDNGWPTCHNQFDGYVHWNHVTGKGKVIPDGDFIRLNTLGHDNEREFEISLHVMAGGPLEAADQWYTGEEFLRFYQNKELNVLVKERFVGHPMGDWRNLSDARNQIWVGETADGGYVVGLFNRENSTQRREISFSEFGANGKWKMRDLWRHVDEGEGTWITAELPARSCKIVKLSK